MSYIKSTVRRATGTARARSSVLKPVNKFSGYAMGTPTTPSSEFSNRVRLIGDPPPSFKFVSLLDEVAKKRDLAELQETWVRNLTEASIRLRPIVGIKNEYAPFSKFLVDRGEGVFNLCLDGVTSSYLGTEADLKTTNTGLLFPSDWYGIFNDYADYSLYPDIDPRTRVEIAERVRILKIIQRLTGNKANRFYRHQVQASFLQLAMNLFSHFHHTDKLFNDIVLWSFLAISQDPDTDTTPSIVEALKTVYNTHSSGRMLARHYVVSEGVTNLQESEHDRVYVHEQLRVNRYTAHDKKFSSMFNAYTCQYLPEISNIFMF
ncbi:hypothetical protein [Vibrio phage 29Fa.3]|nr:hypothetical protein [Vibrio phage 29Fa.3]